MAVTTRGGLVTDLSRLDARVRALEGGLTDLEVAVADPGGGGGGGGTTVDLPWVNVKDLGAKGDGAVDDTAAIQAAINSLPDPGGAIPANGGVVYFPRGTYICSGTITVPSNIILIGEGGLSGGGGIGGTPFAATQLVYTGAGTRFLDCRGTYGVTLRDLQIYYNNASFTGILVDFDEDVAAQIATLMRLDNVALELGGSTRSAILLGLNKAVGGYFTGCKFAGGGFGVVGKTAGATTNQSNAHTFIQCVFVAQLTAHVKNANENWNFHGCWFEPLFTAGGVSAGAGGYTQDAGMTTWGLSFYGCWFGDATKTGFWISGNGQTINALTVSGCVFGPADTHIYLNGTTGVGAVITGNEFVGSFTALDVTGGAVSDVTLRGNYFGTGVIPIFGTAGGRSQIQWTGGAAGGAANSASFDGDIIASQVGGGLKVKEGTNAKMGTATMNGTTAVVVSTTAVTASSRVFLTYELGAGTVGAPYVSTRTAGTSFSIKSTTAGDTSTCAWMIVEPA